MTDHTIGRYDVIRILGKGAMGVVYEARDPRLDRKVAIKTIRRDDLTPAQATAYEGRFLTEARSVARLSHPNIVSVYDAGQAGDATFLVMEFVQGVNLKHCLNHGVLFSPGGAVQILLDVLNALGHAHEQKIVHRDIKPENILMDAAGTIKLTDFGIAKILDADVDNGTQVAGNSIGTPRYMSPEQVRGVPLDERSDLFSAGVLLYELLTASLPFDGAHHLAIATQILHDMPTPPSVKAPGVPLYMDEILHKALAKRPDDRFQSAAEFRSELMDAITALPDVLNVGVVDSAAQLVRPDTAGVLRWLLDRTPGAGMSGTNVESPTVHTQGGNTAAPAVGATNTTQTSGGRTGAHATKQAFEPSEYPGSDNGTMVFPRTRPMGLDGLSPSDESHPAPLPDMSTLTTAEQPKSRKPLWAAVGAVVLGGVLWWALGSGKPPPAPVVNAPPPAPVTDPAQTLSPKEELVLPAPVVAAPATEPATAPGVAAPPAEVPVLPAKSPEAIKRAKEAAAAKAAAAAAAAAASSSATTAPVQDSPPPPPVPKPKPEPAPVAVPKPAAPAEPCTGMTFFERESCMWKQCYTDTYRSHPACKRFNP